MNHEKRIKQIETENKIWIIYLIIIALSYYANYFEKNYFETKNTESKNKYRKINTLIFTILLIIYLYFEKEAYSSLNDKNKKSKKRQNYDLLIFIASTLVLISGIIFLYIIITDEDIEEEIAFN